MMCIIYESYEIGCADIVCILCGYTYILYIGGRDPYCTGGVRRRCYINIYLEEGAGREPVGGGRRCYCIIYTYIWRKGPVLHGRSAKTVLWYTYMCNFTNDWEWMAMCDIYVCVCVWHQGYVGCVIVYGIGDIWYWSCVHLSASIEQ